MSLYITFVICGIAIIVISCSIIACVKILCRKRYDSAVWGQPHSVRVHATAASGHPAPAGVNRGYDPDERPIGGNRLHPPPFYPSPQPMAPPSYSEIIKTSPGISPPDYETAVCDGHKMDESNSFPGVSSGASQNS